MVNPIQIKETPTGRRHTGDTDKYSRILSIPLEPACKPSTSGNHTTPEAIYPFDARGIAKRLPPRGHLRCAGRLGAGETMRFCNDHDPLAAARPTPAALRRNRVHHLPAARARRDRHRFRQARLSVFRPRHPARSRGLRAGCRTVVIIVGVMRAGQPAVLVHHQQGPLAALAEQVGGDRDAVGDAGGAQAVAGVSA